MTTIANTNRPVFPPASSNVAGGQAPVRKQQSVHAPDTTTSNAVTTEGFMYPMALARAMIGKSTLQEWESKGLNITEDSIRAVLDVLNQANREILFSGKRRCGVGVAYNIHHIIEKAQEVPDWFREEKACMLNLTEPAEVRELFRSGALYYIDYSASEPSNLNANHRASVANLYRKTDTPFDEILAVLTRYKKA